MSIGDIWNLIALQPVINVLIVLTRYLFGSFGLAIIVLTVAVNTVMYPLTLKQIRSTKAMQTLQPKLAELQKKYAKDRQKLAQEQMKLYRESGMSPTGCLLPMFAQMPVWIALYQAIIRVLAVTPEEFLGLSQFLYSWPLVDSMLPLGDRFLWFNLATPNSVLAILVAATMWLQQKMSTPSAADPRQAAQNRMMLWMMPLMFGFISLSFPSGLALFWVTSSVIRIVMQYNVTGWGGLLPSPGGKPVSKEKKYIRRISEAEKKISERATSADIVVEPKREEGLTYGESGDKRQDRGGGYPKGPGPIRRQPGRGKHHRPKGG